MPTVIFLQNGTFNKYMYMPTSVDKYIVAILAYVLRAYNSFMVYATYYNTVAQLSQRDHVTIHAFDVRTDRRTDGQTDRQTELSSLDRVCIPCSAAIIKIIVKN